MGWGDIWGEFPAPAGINRFSPVLSTQIHGVPRASGDKPQYDWQGFDTLTEFPAPAGINRSCSAACSSVARVPRASGDKPVLELTGYNINASSPRQRG